MKGRHLVPATGAWHQTPLVPGTKWARNRGKTTILGETRKLGAEGQPKLCPQQPERHHPKTRNRNVPPTDRALLRSRKGSQWKLRILMEIISYQSEGLAIKIGPNRIRKNGTKSYRAFLISVACSRRRYPRRRYHWTEQKNAALYRTAFVLSNLFSATCFPRPAHCNDRVANGFRLTPSSPNVQSKC